MSKRTKQRKFRRVWRRFIQKMASRKRVRGFPRYLRERLG